ncbi:HdeD family acid-resistance protein [Streptomyces nondiastaticus]|uniref:HdeD family acid-resistance protein n=1 Tax=Streptomyces nondiastaticus TaxID=3154512 RepID=A0ABW6U6A8_9ACTN
MSYPSNESNPSNASNPSDASDESRAFHEAYAAAAGPGEPGGPGEPPTGMPAGLTMLANAGWQVMVSAGVASVALGVVVLAWPKASLTVVGVLFGIYLLAMGVFQLAGAFGAHVPGHMRALGFVSGGICVLLGLVAFRGPAQSVLLLALWIGFGWLLRGVMLTGMALSVPSLPARGWQVFLGVVSVLAGIVVITSPFASIAVLTAVVGIMLIVMGLIEVGHGIRLRTRLGKLSAPGAHRGGGGDRGGRGHRWHAHPQH